ncbi:HAD family hydrolase [uncultured Merdimonas sp.]|uniref:HAD family hydrolase n=1 Tax=uncultured Merdimonas sp. TaxID=2023269 RepID=UPI0032087BAE
MKIRCIALDLDRTTLNSRGKLSRRNLRAIRAAIDRGVQVVVASGRPAQALPAEITEIPGIRYAVVSNGASVWDLQSKEKIQEYKLTPVAVEQLLDVTEKAAADWGIDVAYEMPIDGIAYAQASYVADPVRYGARPESVPYIRDTRRPVEDICTFIKAHIRELDCMNIVIGKRKEELWNKIQAEVADVYVTTSVKQLLEITHKDGGKASAMRSLLERLGIEAGQLLAFGDGDNDKELLEMAGLGIAVANAVPGCKASADRITLSNDEDGVGAALEQLMDELGTG